jgi:hypothetical protein
MPLGLEFNLAHVVRISTARLGSQCPANDASDVSQLLLPMHKTPEENQTSESRLSKPQVPAITLMNASSPRNGRRNNT